jgi:UDP-N-acetyl-D-glucosamine/UDP-N-acetyl-D-galactosamine dehydrogenase
MLNFKDLKNKKEKLCIVGLGYVGLPLALYLNKYFEVVGFDIDSKKIEELKNNIDRTCEVDSSELQNANLAYYSDPEIIKSSKFIIIAVPTPIDKNNKPDLKIIKSATETVGKNLTKDSVVVFESTVYPGLTEEICVPILEENSGLKAGKDFKVGYSPERINPGDKEHTIDKITKVVSGMDVDSLDLIASVYGEMTKVYKAKSIKVAEASKVIENTQRDLNIAFMNELAVLFNKMNISTYDVLEAAGTKWNFLKFYPGLVGGHCIGVDPYYLTSKAEEVGYDPKVILAGRQINDNMMPKFIAEQIVIKMKELNKNLNKSKVVIFGITFKENIKDIRNSKVVVVYNRLKELGLNPVVCDPLADKEEVKREYNIELVDLKDIGEVDTLVVAVGHDQFKNMKLEDLRSYMNRDNVLLVDIKKLYNKKDINNLGINYWTL